MRKSFLIIFVFLISAWAKAQILDDSTKQVYSRETTFYFYEDDVIDGELNQYNPDTTVDKIYRYNWQTRNNNLYQDLGNLGSALFPVFYEPRKSIGVNYGVRIYDAYHLNPDEIRYYNTRSPFTQIHYVQGANNFANLNVEFSRNIGPYFNSTIQVDRFTSDKNLANIGRDRLIEHWNFVYNTSYRSKNGRYMILYNYSHMNHEVEEQGGIRPLPDDRIPEDLFLYQSANVWINDAFTWERRNNHHIYQHFKFLRDSTSDFRLFHEFDRVNIKDRYRDDNLLDSDTFTLSFYNNRVYENTESSFHQLQYTLYENKLGLGGSFRSRFFYRSYLRHRYFYSNLTNEWNTELFVGGTLRTRINSFVDSLDILASGESALPGDYRLGINVRGHKINLELFRIFYSPDIIQDRFLSNHFIWNNDFKRTLSDNLKASYQFKFGKQIIKPFAKLHRISDYIYYNEDALPEQSSGVNTLLYSGVEANLQLWKFHLDGLFQYGQMDGPDVFRFPEFYSLASLYFETLISRGRSIFQIGFESFYRSSYFGNAYMPATFQYHLQDDFLMRDAIVPDFFASFQFRKAQAFIKVPYFIQGWAVEGYFSSPFYTGVQRPDVVSLGFRWQFYD